MTLGTAAVLAVVIAMVVLAIRSIIKDKKAGKGCGSCPGGCSCHSGTSCGSGSCAMNKIEEMHNNI